MGVGGHASIMMFTKKKIFKIIGKLFEEKKHAITTLGFGGLLQLACKEISFNLFHWIITHYEGFVPSPSART